MASVTSAIRRTTLAGVRRYYKISCSPKSAPLSTSIQSQSRFDPVSTPRPFHSTPAQMAITNPFLDAIKARRTYYQLEASSPISDERIQEIVNQVFLYSPSAFNSQSTRALVLLGGEHQKLWGDIVKPAIRAVAPPEAWPTSEQKLSRFQNAYGTVLLFEDQQVVEGLQKAIALYADKFPQWSEHTNGIHAFNLWTALEQEGLGASLQHYNPLIDENVAKTWGIPADWSLKAQLVFGKPAGQPDEKTFKPLEQRVKYFGGNLTKN